MSYDVISILAGGYSAKRHDVLRLPGFVIGVNDSAIYGRVDAVLSMDRLWTESRYSRIKALGVPTWLRDSALKNIPPNRPGWIVSFKNNHESSVMTDEPGVLNGTNSGLCAVNLGYQLRPRVLKLYGMDLANGPHGEKHWYPAYDFKPPYSGTGAGTFKQWQGHLDDALRQCREIGIKVEVMK